MLEPSTDPETLVMVALLTEVAGKLASVRSFEEMVQSVIAVLEQIIAVEYTGFFLVDPEDGTLRLVAARGFSEREQAEAQRTATERHPGWVVRNAQILHVPDVDADPEQRTQDSAGRQFRIRSRLYMPVIGSQGCVGAYGLASANPHRFSDWHIALLKYASSLTGATYGSLANERKLNQQLKILSQKQAELLLLSSPVIEVSDRTLALPIIGTIDKERAQHMAERLLSLVVARRAHTVILDFTGTADLGPASVVELMRICGAVELLGSRCVFSGVSPSLAKALAEDTENTAWSTSIKSHATLKQALALRTQTSR